MSAYYQTVLSLNIVVFVLAAGLIAAYQAVAGARSPREAQLLLRDASLSAFIVLAFLNMFLAIAGAVLLGTEHDFVPGTDLGIDAILASPGMGLAIGATTVLCAALAVRTLLRASRALGPAARSTLDATSVQPRRPALPRRHRPSPPIRLRIARSRGDAPPLGAYAGSDRAPRSDANSSHQGLHRTGRTSMTTRTRTRAR